MLRTRITLAISPGGDRRLAGRQPHLRRVRRSSAVLATCLGGIVAAACGSTSRPDIGSDQAVGLKLRFGALSERTIDVEADGRNATAAVNGMNAFAIDLYKEIAVGSTDNVVLSPYSVTFALGQIYAGASGQTATEMASVLHADIPAADWHEGISAYDLSLDARTAGSPTTW
jgi:serpin B